MLTRRFAADHPIRAFDALWSAFLDDAVGHPVWHAGVQTHWDPAAPTLEATDTEYVISAAIPGVPADGVQLAVENGVLRLTAERKQQAQEGTRFLHRERASFALKRSWRLPNDADTDGIRAEHKHGVLRVTLQRKVAPTRRITISEG